ncbi:unnamed protein product [Lactuca saligna]|uniref:Uncharacterized protein n=1 Tax=Lactuca saligna TaxID=75948 RepID=A0AA35VMX0_LACSI|nr:unnamed protein product [Lactuca saligna]
METIMQKLIGYLRMMKTSLANLQQTYTTVNTDMQTLLHDVPEELPYKELTVATHVIADLDNITVLMLDMFGMMQENISEAIDVCNKIPHNHQTP